MKISSVNRYESKSLPGVTYVLRKITAWRRDELNELTQTAIAKLPEREEYVALSTERGELEGDQKSPLSEEKEMRWLELNILVGRYYAREVMPEIVNRLLVRIEGLELGDEDGNPIPATVATLKAHSEETDKLWAEIVETINHERGLSPAEAKNSESPSTSVAGEAGKIDSATSAIVPEPTAA